MKKIAVLFALAALATAGGCVSNAGQFCLKQAECADKFFGLEAAGADGACEDQAKDQFDCFADNL